MAQVSYGTITITDTNDIERIYMEYAQSSSPSTAPTTGWSENIPAWEQGKYIWQRTVVKKEGVALSSDSYGDPVCLTGSTGSTGSTGRGVSSIVTTYCNYGTGTPAANYSGWSSTVPAYDSTKPNYWIKTVITYTTGTPATDTKIYQDNGITSATATAASAKTQAAAAEDKADAAVSTANTANTNASSSLNLANGINQHFWWIAEDTSTTGGTIPAGAYITDIAQSTFKSNPGSYGNLLLRSDGVYLNLGLQTLASFKSNALTFYNSAGTELGTFGSTGLSMSGTLDIRGGGRIGQDSSNYWKFGDNRSYKDTDSAYLIGYGNSSIQLGKNGHWRLDRNRIHSGWYQLDDATQGLLHFDTGTDGSSTYYWDYGINYPNKSGSGTNKFVYVRRSNATTSTTLATMKGRVDDDSYWTYKFYVDGDGNVHAPGFYVGDSTTPIGGGANTIAQKIINSDGTTYGKGSTTQPIYIDSSGYVQTIGYTIQTSVPANAVFTDTLNTAGSTDTSSKLFLIGATTQAANPQTYSNSGTYAQSDKLYSNSKEVVNLSDSQALTNKTYNGYTLAAASAKGVDTSITVASTSTNLPTSAAVASLVSQYLPLTGGNITGEVSFGDSVTADELTVGDLVVNGAASFTNNLQVNTINGVGVGSSPKFTDTVTTVSTTGSGNAITAASATNGAITFTKGTTFPTGSGTSGYLIKWTGANTIGNGPQLGSATNTFLRNDGTWATPAGTYSLSVATYNTLGGVKPAYSTTGAVSLTTAAAANTTTPTIAAKSTTSGRYYAVEIDKNGVLFVNVPWTNVNSSYLTGITSNDVTTALGYTPYNAENPNGYTTNTGTVTSVRVQASSPLQSSTSTASSTTLNTTISFINQSANKVLAGPSSGNAAAPSFRSLVAADIPNLSWTKITSDKPTTLSGYGITDAAGNNALVGLSASSNAQGVTTFTATRASGQNPLSFEVSITASSATGATKLTDSQGDISLGNASNPVYFSGGVPAQANTIPTITLNGSSTTTASFYAPTTAGTSGYVLKSNGTGAPTWIPQSDISSGNTYTTTIATDSGTNQLTLEHATKYKLTAGGTSFIFTMPSDTDEKLKVAAVTSGTTYYPIVGTGTTATTRQYDTTGFVYVGTNGTANSSNGNALLTLGNSTASTTANWKKGTIRLYGTTAYYIDIVSGAPTANRTITLPNKTGTVALTSDIPTVPTTTQSATTGIAIADHGTTSVGSASNWSAGTASSWVFENKTVATAAASATSIPNVTGVGTASSWVFEEISVPNVTGVGSTPSLTITSTSCDDITSWSQGSLTFAIDTTDTSQLNITFTKPSLGYTAKTVGSASGWSAGSTPTLGTAIKIQSKKSGSNSTTPTLGTAISITGVGGTTTVSSKKSGSNSTVPSLTITSTTVVNGKSHTITDNGHSHAI